MPRSRYQFTRRGIMIALILLMPVISIQLRADNGACSGVNLSVPFTDVAGSFFFCAIAEAYFSGLTNGTTPTTYSPSDAVPREQMAAFVTRTLDQSLKRGGRRAGLTQWWTPQSERALGYTSVGSEPSDVISDGDYLWVTNHDSGTVSQVQASTGKIVGTWTGMSFPFCIVAARGKIYVGGTGIPGRLYEIDPAQSPGAATLLVAQLADKPLGMTFDGSRIWTVGEGGISIVTFSQFGAFATTVNPGLSIVTGIIYDGSSIWVCDANDKALKKLDADGNVLQSVPLGSFPRGMVFDGTNIWVAVSTPTMGNVTIVRAATGQIIASLTGNGLNSPHDVAFDGERILVTNYHTNNLSLWRATDLAPLGSLNLSAGTGPYAVCSDGLNFWMTLRETDKLARF